MRKFIDSAALLSDVYAAQALVYALLKDGLFHTLSEQEKDHVTNCILEEVRGRMPHAQIGTQSHAHHHNH